MTGNSPPGGVSGATGSEPEAGPVAAVQVWLASQGASVPAETSSTYSGRRVAQRDDAKPPAASDGELDADSEEVARQIVLRKLAVQARTRGELAKALKTKAVPEAAAAAVLDRMTEVGLIDDAGFARDWVASRQQRRHLSRSALRRELQGKGVDRDEIEAALAPVGVDDEYQAALSLARRRHASMGHLDRDVRYRRLAGVLGRRGFGPGVVTQVLGSVLDGADDQVDG